ncbi:MAG: F0F1 ATP synthase subunit A [Ghiorsea sp.]
MGGHAEEHTATIADHLEYWTYKFDDSNPFMQIHVDTMIMTGTIALALIGFALWFRGRITEGAPTGVQNFVETVVSFINDTVDNNFSVHNPYMAPLALTIFVFIALCNSIDILPAYLIGHIAHSFGIPAFRPVPTNDLNLPLAMALSVFVITIYYELKLKPLHFLKDMVNEPFTSLVPIWAKPIVMPINLLLKIVEEIAKPLSLSFRLFGNMFAGEVIFLLIAFLLLSDSVDGLMSVGGIVAEILGFVIALGWSFFHMFIGFLQAFIFMTLTVVYLSMAHQPVEH